MGPSFQAMTGAEGWQLSNPSIMSMAVLRASMDIFHDAGMERLRSEECFVNQLPGVLAESRKSPELLDHHTARKKRRGRTTLDPNPQNGQALCEQLAGEGIVGDWREPDTFRVAPVPSVQLLSGCIPVC
jgi:kynureninase